MPTPQEDLFFVEQASCLLWIMLQHLSCTPIKETGFLPNLRVSIKYFVKNPVSGPHALTP